MDGRREALIVASYEFEDPGLRSLRAPAQDAEALARVLTDPLVGHFGVRTMVNEPQHVISEAVEEFFADRVPDDLLLFYFTGHGIKDEDGELYFAAANTRARRLGATGLAASFVNRCVSRSRSRRVVLLLDCCYAGAFERGMVARTGMEAHVEEHLGGRGRAVITATSAMQYAFEGDRLTDAGDPGPSVFTRALVEGLETGDADRDQDGRVDLDELYDYVYERVREVTPNQTPGKWTFGIEGELYVARRRGPARRASALPPELAEAMEHPLASVRLGVVQDLASLLVGEHPGLALGARLALQRLAGDDSRRVAAAASAALDRVRAECAGPGRPEAATPAAEPHPAVPAAEAPPPPVRGTVGRPRADRLLLAAGVLALASAAIALVGLVPTYQNAASDHPLAADPYVLWYVLILSALAIAAGLCILGPPGRRLAGAGLLVGQVAAATVSLLSLASLWVQTGGLGHGYTLLFAANVILVLGACAVVPFLRREGVRIAAPHFDSRFAPAVIGAGALGTLAWIFNLTDLVIDSHGVTFADLAVLAIAFVAPAAGAAAAPRQFAVAVVVAWIAGGLAILVANVLLRIVSGWTVLPVLPFGLALAVLAAAVVPFARTGRQP